MTRYKLLGLLTLQKSMLIYLIESDEDYSLSFNDELINVQKGIAELNSKGVVERRTSERRAQEINIFLEKRVNDRRVFHRSFSS